MSVSAFCGEYTPVASCNAALFRRALPYFAYRCLQCTHKRLSGTGIRATARERTNKKLQSQAYTKCEDYFVRQHTKRRRRERTWHNHLCSATESPQ